MQSDRERSTVGLTIIYKTTVSVTVFLKLAGHSADYTQCSYQFTVQRNDVSQTVCLHDFLSICRSQYHASTDRRSVWWIDICFPTDF